MAMQLLFLVLYVCALAEGEQGEPWWSSSSYRLYDDLRSSSRADVQVTSQTGSKVLEVEMEGQEEFSSMSSSFRLCHVPMVNGKVRRVLLTTDASAFLAMVHFNEKVDTIVPELSSDPVLRDCDLKLTTEYYNSMFSPMESSRIVVNEMMPVMHSLQTPHPCAIVGAGRSAASAALSIMSSLHDIPAINGASTSSSLDNKDIYQLFGRTIPTDAGIARAAVSYFHDFLNITHIGVLYLRDDFGSSYHAEFTRAAFAQDPPMVIASAAYDDAPLEESIEIAMKQLKQSGFNYFFGIGLSFTFDEVLRIGKRVGVIGPGKYWLFTSDLAKPFLLPDFSWDADLQKEEAEASNGVGVITLDIPVNDVYQEEWLKFLSEEAAPMRDYFWSLQPPTVNRTLFPFTTTNIFTEYLRYDAVMAIGIAACKTQDRFFNGTSLFDTFKKLTFLGASGVVSFDENTGTRDYRDLAYKVVSVTTKPEEEDVDGGGKKIGIETTVVAQQQLPQFGESAQ